MQHTIHTIQVAPPTYELRVGKDALEVSGNTITTKLWLNSEIRVGRSAVPYNKVHLYEFSIRTPGVLEVSVDNK